MRLITAAVLSAAFNARHPHSVEGGTVDLAASAETGSRSETVDSIQAQAMRSYSQVSGPLAKIKATEHFYVAGELIMAGDIVEVTDSDAKIIVNAGRAEFATDEDVAAATAETQKAAKGK